MESDPLASLKATFHAHNWHRKTTGRIVLELAVHVSLAIGGIALFVFAQPLWLRLLGLLVSTYGSVGVGTNTHTATHYAASHRRWVNEVLTYFGYPFFLQLGATFWRHRHITLHHPNPNIMGIDGDADFSPFFASTEQEVAGSSGRFREYIRYQWIFFPLIVWVNGFLRQIGSWRHVVRCLRDPKLARTAHWVDVGVMLLHWVAWFVIPSFFFPWMNVVGFNLLRIALLGYPLFAVLAPGHYPSEAYCIANGPWQRDFILLQTAGTINFRTGPIGAFVCSGLQYQIEHHLFPGYSHTHYAKMAPYVQAFCQEKGYPYRSLGWLEALWSTLKIFYRPKPVAADINELRQRVDADMHRTAHHPAG